MTLHERLLPGKYRLRGADYEVLAEAGAFGDARTELIEGDVFVMSPQLRPHGFAKTELYDQLRDALRALGSPLRAMSEVSLDLPPDAMPAPDILVTSDPRGRGAMPRASVVLVVEVSDTTRERDLGDKLRLYARNGIPEYWVADLNGRAIHQLWAPSGEGYGEQREVAFGERLAAATIAGLTIDTGAL